MLVLPVCLTTLNVFNVHENPKRWTLADLCAVREAALGPQFKRDSLGIQSAAHTYCLALGSSVNNSLELF